MRVCVRGRECGSGVRVWREQDMDVGVDMGVWRGSGCEWVRRRAERSLQGCKIK